MVNTTQPSDDFFSLLEKEQKENGPIQDEIIFRDPSGQMKVLKGGQIFDYGQKPPLTAQKSGTATPVLAVKPPPMPPAAAVSPGKPQVISFEDRLPALAKMPPLASAYRQPSDFGQSLTVADYQQAAVAVITSAGITLTDSDLAKRLKNIIVSNLRNIRDRVETKEMLAGSSLAGGVGLDEAIADKLIDASEKKREELAGAEPKAQPPADLQKEAESLLAQVPPAPKPQAEKPPAAPKPQIPPRPQVQKPPEPLIVPPKPIQPDIPVKVQPPRPLPAPQPVLKSREIITEPVRFSPKLLDPIEEIRTMSLADFRRFDPDPAKVIQTIAKKIALLEEESLVQKVKGINAWKESEPYRLYLALGLQAMEEKRSMDVIAVEKQSAGQQTLSPRELEAIMELNYQLRY